MHGRGRNYPRPEFLSFHEMLELWVSPLEFYLSWEQGCPCVSEPAPSLPHTSKLGQIPALLVPAQGAQGGCRDLCVCWWPGNWGSDQVQSPDYFISSQFSFTDLCISGLTLQRVQPGASPWPFPGLIQSLHGKGNSLEAPNCSSGRRGRGSRGRLMPEHCEVINGQQQLKNGKLLIKKHENHHLLCGFIGTKCRGGFGCCQPQGQELFCGNFGVLSSSKCSNFVWI